MMKRILGVAVGILAASLLQQTANAALSPISDALTIRDGSGTISQFFSITEQDEFDNPSAVWRLDSGIANPLQWGFATVLTEPGGSVSDVFGVARDPISGNFYLGFMSDAEGAPLDLTIAHEWFGPTFAATIPEAPGGVYNATPYLNLELLAQGYTATFQSDFEVVPEPTTMLAGALLLLPFAGSALHILRKR